jgi:sigma-B regulation protein RsbU (phosphoserine phosphatase)
VAIGYLTCRDERGAVRRLAVESLAVIGRSPDCDFVIDDPAASRRHAEVTRIGNDFCWRDLGSTNGTACNEAVLAGGPLRPGDVLRIGETRIRFEQEQEAPEPPPSSFTSTHIDWFKGTVLGPEGDARPSSIGARQEAMLRAVCTLMSDISLSDDICGLADRVLETSCSAIDAQRAAVFFAGPDSPELLPCPECGHVHMLELGNLRHARPGEIRVSNTVARRVLRDKESVLYQDTRQDREITLAQSVIELDLRSIICAPIRGQNNVAGILYVDSNRPDQPYTDDDMLLVAAVGNAAGLALENVHLQHEMLEKQRIEQEIEHAWTIQQGFLVKSWPEDTRRFEVFGETRPAKVVGGDFYDFVQPAGDRVGILVGDVSGKGVGAALTMAQVLAEFRLRVQTILSPAEVLTALNQDLAARSNSGIFCTLHYITLDLNTGRMASANAGHFPALRIGKSGLTPFGEASGPPLGVVQEVQWTEVQSTLQPGEALLLYSDGIVEARLGAAAREDNGFVEFGIHGIEQAVAGESEASPRRLIEAVNQAVRAFCAPAHPHDDCTMIALRYSG